MQKLVKMFVHHVTPVEKLKPSGWLEVFVLYKYNTFSCSPAVDTPNLGISA